MKIWISFLALTLANAASAGIAEIEAIRKKYNVPALGVSMISYGQATTYVAGVRKWGDPTLAQPNDKFHLGSCSKAMTATLLALFIEKGLLRWNSSMEELFPELVSNMPEPIKKITVEMLSSHRSGITLDLMKFNNGKLWNDLWDNKLDPVRGRLKVTQIALTNTSLASPGTKFFYNNVNYIVIGSILEKISGLKWEELMLSEIFAPLDMKSCGFGAQADPKANPVDQPWPHKLVNNRPAPVVPDFFGDNPPTLGPAGSVHCSLQDWGKFALLHLNGFNGLATAILSNDSFTKLHSQYPGQEYTYGGWIRATASWALGDILTHSGSNTLNYAIITIAPRVETTIMGVANSGGASASNATDDALVEIVSE